MVISVGGGGAWLFCGSGRGVGISVGVGGVISVEVGGAGSENPLPYRPLLTTSSRPLTTSAGEMMSALDGPLLR